MVPWDIEFTNEFDCWWNTLDVDEQERIRSAIEILEEAGPGLGRPLVDSLKGSRHAHMKELRPPGDHLRVLFAFDPRRMAILLIGGDKTNRWKEWYEEAIPEADALYDEHLDELRVDELRAEGEMP